MEFSSPRSGGVILARPFKAGEMNEGEHVASATIE